MPQLRDIRADLEARISGVEEDIVAEEERHQHLLEQLTRRRDLLKQMLEDEERRWARTQPSLFAFPLATEGRAKTPLTELVCDIMSDGQRWSLDRLAQAVEERGWNFSGKNPRRVMHFTLLGLKNKGSAEMPVSGSWRLHTQVRESDAAPS